MRPSRALAKQSLDSSTIWWWMKLRTPSASGRMFSGEKAWMNSASFPSICAVAWHEEQGWGLGCWEVGRMEAKIECEWEGWERQRLGLGNDWLSYYPAVCDTKLGHRFDFWIRHCTAILISIPLCVSFFFLTHVRTKGSSLRWIPSWNARFYQRRSIKPISFDINPPRKSSWKKKGKWRNALILSMTV